MTSIGARLVALGDATKSATSTSSSGASAPAGEPLFAVGYRIGVELLHDGGDGPGTEATIVGVMWRGLPSTLPGSQCAAVTEEARMAWPPLPHFSVPFPFNHHELCPVADLLGFAICAEVVVELIAESSGPIATQAPTTTTTHRVMTDSRVIVLAPEALRAVEVITTRKNNFGFHAASPSSDARLIVLTSPAVESDAHQKCGGDATTTTTITTQIEVREVPDDAAAPMRIVHSAFLAPPSVDFVELAADNDVEVALRGLAAPPLPSNGAGGGAAHNEEEGRGAGLVSAAAASIVVKTRKDRDNLALYLRARHAWAHWQSQRTGPACPKLCAVWRLGGLEALAARQAGEAPSGVI